MKKLLATLILSVAAIAFAQSAKSSTTLDAATCFKVEGISALQVSRGPQDYLILNSSIQFVNFTDKVLGRNQKQDIRIKDLDLAVYLTDATQPPKKIEKIENGKLVIIYEYSKVKVGKVSYNDFMIPKGGLSTVVPIAVDQVTENGNGNNINNGTFDKLVMFFNLLNGTPEQRAKSRIIFEGTCKVAVKGENNAWMWSPTDINFEWTLKPSNENSYLLEIIE